MTIELTIQSGDSKKRKGRSFRGVVLAYATATGLWSSGSTGDVVRPVFTVLGAADEEARPLLENLRAGERATLKGEEVYSSRSQLELLRSANYAFHLQRTGEGTLITAYLPELFEFQPGLLDPDGVRFVVVPARQDVDAIPVSVEETRVVVRHLEVLEETAEASRELCAMAALWAAYFDQRSELPIPPELSFRVQLYLAALQEGIASTTLPLRGSGDGDVHAGQHAALGFRLYVSRGFPLVPGVATKATHEELGVFFAEQIERYEQARKAAPRGRTSARARRNEAA